jgi:hypothetical protein
MCSAPLFRFSDLYEISIHLAERQSRGRLGYRALYTVLYCTTLDVGFCAEDGTKMALGYHDFLILFNLSICVYRHLYQDQTESIVCNIQV